VPPRQQSIHETLTSSVCTFGCRKMTADFRKDFQADSWDEVGFSVRGRRFTFAEPFASRPALKMELIRWPGDPIELVWEAGGILQRGTSSHVLGEWTRFTGRIRDDMSPWWEEIKSQANV
jgi:hypothetical protein